LFLLAVELNAQNNIKYPLQRDKIAIGLEMGLDYGGLGYNLLVYPYPKMGLFCGTGYALAGIGFNAGAKLRLVSDWQTSKIVPYILGMYGYNAAIYYEDLSEYNKLFYGWTVGLGVDLCPPKKDSYWSFSFLIPLRSQAVSAYTDDVQRNHGKTLDYFFPFTLSISNRLIIK